MGMFLKGVRPVRGAAFFPQGELQKAGPQDVRCFGLAKPASIVFATAERRPEQGRRKNLF
ncbi:MAG: hypothetical protein D6715_09100 [Calditrichaeota bacterium]|nr:MAG: hypothetical protein D6715_09100 [Calditrichota bacterium]